MVMMYVHALVRRDVFFFLILFDTHRSPPHMRDVRQEKEKGRDEVIHLARVKTPRRISGEQPTTGRLTAQPSRKGLFFLSDYCES